MTLVLEYRAATPIPVEVEGLTPDGLRDRSLAEIERSEIFHGNEKLPLAELFRVSGEAGDLHQVWQGNLAGVHWIGAGMTAGRVEVEGPAGRHVGSEMRGGEIQVRGDASDWVGGEMHGGLIHVHGRAGHLLGAAYRGSRRGMTGGTIVVDGEAGNEVGHTMRRGLLVVGGPCGDFPGINLIAGTLLVLGDCGQRPAAGMRRGTLGLCGAEPVRLLPSFRYGSRCRPLFLQLLYRQLAALGFCVPGELLECDYHLYHGDLVTVGRGEILLPAR
jgi:formylmethanofuran dehydrogenase subunit C